jgi:hypothetical protein
MRRRAERALGVGAGLAVVTVVLWLAGSALADGSRVHATVGGRVRAGVRYTITVSGYAASPARLYLFADYRPCARNPHAEYYTHHVGGLYKRVSGRFSSSSTWRTPRVGIDHACAYLQAITRRLNATGGLLARGATTYRVH